MSYMKTGTLTIRLDKDLASLISRASRASGRNRSEIAREALRRQLKLEQFEQLRRKAMRDYLLCREGDNAKVGYLRTALMAHEKLLKMLQDAGLLTKVPERFSLESNIPFDDPEVRQAYLNFLKLAREKGEKNLGL